MPLKILHVAPTYWPAVRYGGPIFAVHGLCKALAARGHEVHVFTTDADGDGHLDVPLNTPVERDGVRIWYFSTRFLKRLNYSRAMQEKIKRDIGQFDLAHLHSVFLWPTWYAARQAESKGIPYVVSPRGAMNRSLIKKKSRIKKTLWIKLIERHTLEKAAAIQVTSEIEARELRPFRLNRLSVIPNGIDESTFQTDAKSASANEIVKKPYLLILSRLHPAKGIERLISALKSLPGWNLVIAGNDENRYQSVLERFAEQESVLARIAFTGPVYGNEKKKLFQEASLFVLPSYSENFGNVVLEAMTAGCPVVTTPEVGASEIIQKSGGGWIVEGDSENLSSKLQQILKNPAELKRVGDEAKSVAQHYTWKLVVAQVEALYQQVVRKEQA